MRQAHPYSVQKKEKCLVLLSGGLDSITSAYWAVKQGYSIEALFFDMDQNARDRGLECAMDVADCLKIRLHVLKIPLSQRVLQDMIPLSNLLKKEVPDNSDMSIFEGIIMWLAIGASYALKSETDKIVIGINADNTKMHPGINAEFFNVFEKIVYLWTGKQIKILTPFIEYDKSAIITTGIELGVQFQYTWSCSEGNGKHCGKCANCIIRMNAFASVGIKDPTEYET